MEVLPLFSTPVYVDTCDLTEIDFNMEWQNPCGDDPTYGNNGKISANVNWLEVGLYADLKRTIEAHLSQYVFGVLGSSRGIELEHQSSWVNRHDKGDKARNHVHVNSMFSGVLYLQVPPDSGDLIFNVPAMNPTYCTSTVSLDIVEPNIYNQREVPFTPETGDIIIFPSHLPHYVTASNSDQPRYSLAFNYFAKGVVGYNESRLHIK